MFNPTTPSPSVSTLTTEYNTETWRFYQLFAIIYIFSIMLVMIYIYFAEKQTDEEQEEIAGDKTGYYKKPKKVIVAGVFA